MAAFTSSQSGPWNASATWGKSGDPAVKGTDYPGNAGDTFTISAGHTVTYNVSETNELGASTINGLLTFDSTTNTKITFGHVDLSISATGELRAGSSSAPINSANTCELVWNTTADNTKGILVTASGGKVTAAGSPSVYGSSYVTTLAADWTTGKTFTVTGDYTTKWKQNQILFVPSYGTSSVGTNYCQVTIASLAANGLNTNITINETAPGIACYAGGHVVNVSRNVMFKKYGATISRENRNTNRPRIFDNSYSSGVSGGILDFSNVEISAFYAINQFSNSSCKVKNTSFHNGQGAIYTAYGWDTTSIQDICICCLGSNFSSVYKSSKNVMDNIYSIGGNGTLFTRGIRISISNIYVYENQASTSGIFAICDQMDITNFNSSGCVSIFGSPYPSYRMKFINGTIAAVSTGPFVGANGPTYWYNFSFGWDRDGTQRDITSFGPSSTAYGDGYGSSPEHYCYSCKAPSAGTGTGPNANTTSYSLIVTWDDLNKTPGSFKTVRNFGDITKVTFDDSSSRPAQRSGGSPTGLEVVTYSLCLDSNYVKTLSYKIYAPTGSKTYRFYIQSDYVSLPATEIYLVGTYISNASTNEYSTIQSTQAITTRSNSSDWTQYVDVTINPAAVGFVTLDLYVAGYESGKKIYVDPLLVIS